MALAVAAGLALIVALVIAADGRALLELVGRIHPGALAGAVAITLASYAAMARSYQLIARAAGCHIGFGPWLRITLVSNTVNYVVTSAGLSGLAFRVYLLSRRGVPSERGVLIALVQTFLANFTLSFFILAAFAWLLARGDLGVGSLLAAGGATAVFVGLWLGVIALAARPARRRQALARLGRGIQRFLRALVPGWAPDPTRLDGLLGEIDGGIAFLLDRKRTMIAPTAWIVFDWVLTMGLLWWGFHALGQPIAAGTLLTGFGVGLLFTLVPVLPGGLGAMEGSMALVFERLGVPLAPAVAAVLFFRLLYHVVPTLLSLVLVRGLVRDVRPVADA